MRKSFILVFCAVLFFSCNESSPISVERIIDNSPIEGVPEGVSEVKIGENLPKVIYHKIVNQSFVKERIAALDEQEINHIFWVNRLETDSNKIRIQILAEDEIRWIPIYNFMYDSKSEKLFHMDFTKKTLNDTLILID